MRPEDVYALTGAADPRLHPDGARIAFVVWSIDRDANDYRSAIWLASRDASTPPRKLTSGEARDGAPRWSPDGTRLAFVSSRGDEKSPSQLYVLPIDGGEATKLTELDEDASDIAWSPDGTRIAFATRVRDPAYEEEDERRREPRRFTRLHYKLDNVGWTGDRRKHLFVVAADGSRPPRQLSSGDFDHDAPSWSPDGRRIAFVSQLDDDWDVKLASDLYVADVDGPWEPHKLTRSDANVDRPVWSPDGRQIAFFYRPGTLDWPWHARVAVIGAEGGDTRLLTSALDRQCLPHPEVREPAWDGQRIGFAIEDRGRVHVYSVGADGSGPPELLIGGDVAVTGFDVRGEALVHTAATPAALTELYSGETRLTDVGGAFLAGRDVALPEPFTARSKDGTEVDCWIIRPPGLDADAKCPTLLSVHGGPFTQYTIAFFDEFQVYAGAGYAVVFANPRGSSGYTEAWGRAIRGPSNAQGPGWGTVDYEDVMAAIETAIERYDFVDADRLGVLGGSYGGFMTSWIVSHTNRFRAACSERAVNNLVSAYGSSDLFWAFAGQFGSFLYEDLEAWVERSPSTYAEHIETPLLIMHSENDLRCPIEQGEHLFVTLRLAGKPVEMVRFPSEGHELSRAGSPRHRVRRFEILLEWFDRHLKAGQPSPVERVDAVAGVGSANAR
jgi:dipeptidyl aminopeptidase/acylaminoacyl peptidase